MAIQHFEKKKPLDSSLEDFIITNVDFDDETKKMVAFSVLQIFYSGEHAHEIIKYDTAHGFCHEHRCYKFLNDKSGRRLDKPISPVSFNECRKDIAENWKKYKSAFMRNWKKGS